jgi:hypothetical protein
MHALSIEKYGICFLIENFQVGRQSVVDKWDLEEFLPVLISVMHVSNILKYKSGYLTPSVFE